MNIRRSTQLIVLSGWVGPHDGAKLASSALSPLDREPGTTTLRIGSSKMLLQRKNQISVTVLSSSARFNEARSDFINVVLNCNHD